MLPFSGGRVGTNNMNMISEKINGMHELHEFYKQRQKIISDQDKLKSSGITLTEKDFVNFEMVEKL